MIYLYIYMVIAAGNAQSYREWNYMQSFATFEACEQAGKNLAMEGDARYFRCIGSQTGLTTAQAKANNK